MLIKTNTTLITNHNGTAVNFRKMWWIQVFCLHFNRVNSLKFYKTVCFVGVNRGYSSYFPHQQVLVTRLVNVRIPGDDYYSDIYFSLTFLAKFQNDLYQTAFEDHILFFSNVIFDISTSYIRRLSSPIIFSW